MNGQNRTSGTWARTVTLALSALALTAVATAQNTSTNDPEAARMLADAAARPIAIAQPADEGDGITDHADDVPFAAVVIERIAVYSGDNQLYVTLASDGDAYVDIELATELGDPVSAPIEAYRLRAGEERVGVALPGGLPNGRYNVTITSAIGSETKSFSLRR